MEMSMNSWLNLGKINIIINMNKSSLIIPYPSKTIYVLDHVHNKFNSHQALIYAVFYWSLEAVYQGFNEI